MPTLPSDSTRQIGRDYPLIHTLRNLCNDKHCPFLIKCQYVLADYPPPPPIPITNFLWFINRFLGQIYILFFLHKIVIGFFIVISQNTCASGLRDFPSIRDKGGERRASGGYSQDGRKKTLVNYRAYKKRYCERSDMHPRGLFTHFFVWKTYAYKGFNLQKILYGTTIPLLCA